MTKFFLKLNKIFFTGAIFLVTSTCFAETNYSSEIESIISKYNPNVKVGVEVESLNNGAVIYERNSNQYFVPASSLKTFTAAAALSYLGPDYKFQTKILSNGYNLAQGSLHNNLYIYFDGDPVLKNQNLDEMIAALKNKGIQSISGDVYIDDTIFDQEGFGPGWEWDERNYCYAAPSSAITIDKNCFNFGITTPKKVGKSAGTIKDGSYAGVNIINNIVGKYGSYGDCTIKLSGAMDNYYYLTGCMRPNSRSIYMAATIQNPRLFAKNTLENLFRKHGIKLSGEIKFGKTPSQGVTPLVVYYSKSLSSIVKTMLKKSDNIIANALYKKLGYAYFGSQGNWENGAKAVKGILQNSGVNFSKIKMVDGSGLSRENYVTPHELVSLMKYVYRTPELREQFFNSLPIGGVDGHLEHRMPNLKNRVFAKTGTEKGIVSLAGYIYADNGEVLVFAITINNFSGSVHNYQALEDKVCTALAR